MKFLIRSAAALALAVSLAPHGTAAQEYFSGRVNDDTGHPVAGATVTALVQDIYRGTLIYGSASSGLDGTYQITVLAPSASGQYLLIAKAPGRQITAYPSTPCQSLDYCPGAQSFAPPQSADFSLPASGRLFGTVTRSDTHLPVNAAEVQLGFGPVITADDQGNYLFDNLLPGSYTLLASGSDAVVQGYARHEFDVTMPLESFNSLDAIPVGAGQAVEIDFQLTPGASVGGTMTSAMTGTGVMQNVKIQRINADSTLGGYFLRAREGAYRIDGLAAGDFYLSFEWGDAYVPIYYPLSPRRKSSTSRPAHSSMRLTCS